MTAETANRIEQLLACGSAAGWHVARELLRSNGMGDLVEDIASARISGREEIHNGRARRYARRKGFRLG